MADVVANWPTASVLVVGLLAQEYRAREAREERRELRAHIDRSTIVTRAADTPHEQVRAVARRRSTDHGPS